MAQQEWISIAQRYKLQPSQFSIIDENSLNLQFSKDEKTIGIQKELKQKKSKPIQPIAPEAWECCGSGCQKCILEMYYEQLEKYEQELFEWMEYEQEQDQEMSNGNDHE